MKPSGVGDPPLHDAVVADVGGLLVLAGLLQGTVHQVGEVLALDATTLLLAEYLAVRHEGAPERTRSDYAATTRVVGEWFPTRPLALDAALGDLNDDLETAVSLRLAEALGVPLVTKHAGIVSDTVTVLYC